KHFLDGESISTHSFNLLDRISRALERGHYDVEFRNYGTMLYLFAVLVMSRELAAFLLIWFRQASLWLPCTFFLKILLLGVVFWRYRSDSLLPGNLAERQLWSICIGYVAACAVMGVVTQLQGGLAIELELGLYPYLAAASGLMFFALGSNYWGSCY